MIVQMNVNVIEKIIILDKSYNNLKRYKFIYEIFNDN